MLKEEVLPRLGNLCPPSPRLRALSGRPQPPVLEDFTPAWGLRLFSSCPCLSQFPTNKETLPLLSHWHEIPKRLYVCWDCHAKTL